MNNVTSIKKDLGKFGLTQNQAEIYVFLLSHGHVRISEITRSLKIPRSSVYENLKGLFELGLAEEIVENSFKVIRAYPVASIRHRLDEKMVALQKQTSELDHLEKSLDILPGLSEQAPITIRYYKGAAGARQLFWNTLKAKNTLYVHSEWGRGRYVGIEFYKRFVAESYARDVREQVLTNDLPRVLESIKQHINTPVSRTKVETIRCVPPDAIDFKGDTLMYDNIYAHVFLKNETISGFEIESQQFVDVQRAIFEMLWATARPVDKLL